MNNDKIQNNSSSKTNEKLNKLKEALKNENKCREFARAITEYIKNKK